MFHAVFLYSQNMSTYRRKSTKGAIWNKIKFQFLALQHTFFSQVESTVLLSPPGHILEKIFSSKCTLLFSQVSPGLSTWKYNIECLSKIVKIQSKLSSPYRREKYKECHFFFKCHIIICHLVLYTFLPDGNQVTLNTFLKKSTVSKCAKS